MLRLHALLPAALMAFLLSACASGSSPQSGPAPSIGESAMVRVSNNNWADMNVYMVRSGMRVRLGTVTTMGTRSFRVPKSLMNASGELRLVADPIGSQDVHVSQPVQVWPGQTVQFKIENHLAISSVAVW